MGPFEHKQEEKQGQEEEEEKQNKTLPEARLSLSPDPKDEIQSEDSNGLQIKVQLGGKQTTHKSDGSEKQRKTKPVLARGPINCYRD